MKTKKIKIIAKYNRVNSSDKKIRSIVKIICGKKALEALNILNFINKKSAKILSKVLKSAIYNAKNNKNLDINCLKINNILINKGPMKKKILIRAKGRADFIKKKSSNIYIIIQN